MSLLATIDATDKRSSTDTFYLSIPPDSNNAKRRERGGGTFGGIWTFAFSVSFGVAIETDGDEIFDEETCFAKSLKILFWSGGDLSFGGAIRQ